MTASTLSRRDFLRLAGMTLLATQLPLPAWSAARQPMTARALSAAPVYAEPSIHSAVVRRLWPDSVVTVVDGSAGWYRLADGYVPVESLQPMQPFTPEAEQGALPAGTPLFVSGPAASVREWCAADAPLVTRVGHGGIACAVDYLPDEHTGWYAVCDDSRELLGWTQAVLWSPLGLPAVLTTTHHLLLDRQAGQATVYNGEQAVLQTACSVGDQIKTGDYPLTGRVLSSQQHTWHAVPHTLETGAFRLHGAYWHNRFGGSHVGASVELPTLAASAIYNLLDEKSHIHVV
jgi:hypothetical protein